jgi:heavy metal sensor kinase
MLWIALPVGLLLTIFFGYILTAWSLKPVRAVTRAAGRLGSDDLTVRLKLPNACDEISELTQTFNGMLDRLQDAFKRLQRFAGDVSHELRTPLTVLRGEAELALRRDRTPEEYKKSMAIIAHEAIHMTDIVEDLLLLARAQSQSVAINWELINLREFTDVMTSSVRPIYAKKRLHLNVESNFTQNTLMGSSGYLGLAIKNILFNAAKHSPVDGKVVFRIYEENGFMKFSVKDYGEGIAKEALPYIFDPFFRADTARNRAAGGSGIGLSLAQALVKLHAGKLTVDSEVNQGATFEISIPLDQEKQKLIGAKGGGSKKDQAMLSLPSAPALS